MSSKYNLGINITTSLDNKGINEFNSKIWKNIW